ncbi:SCAN domain-containing protein 3 [Habropoda laboriosa]|uniref:SCAN domain-containing protein 3 n=1 Tax=Habropoda laboriosa TaxID=597456 RepID=A0A0L7QQ58_9HYME|nr:SCAN domain-containing protein 3 [Habropoda laboriosa]
MLRTKSGFQAYVKKRSPQVRGIHCIIHLPALASKSLPVSLGKVLNHIIEVVNFIKGGAVSSRFFKKLCTNVPIMLELRDELKLFYEVQGKVEFFSWLNDKEWLMPVVYLADIAMDPFRNGIFTCDEKWMLYDNRERTAQRLDANESPRYTYVCQNLVLEFLYL